MTTDDKEKKAEQLKKDIARIRSMVRVSKVVCTRSVKGSRGDSYVGFSAAWNTNQDDAGGAADLMSPQESDGLTLKEARLAALLLGMEVDLAAHRHSMAGGNLSFENCEEAEKAIRHNYGKLMLALVENGNGKK